MSSYRFPPDLGFLVEENKLPYVEFGIVKFRDRNLIKDTGPVSGSVPFTTYDGDQTKNFTTILDRVWLPLPANMSNSYSPSWDMAGMPLIETARAALQSNGGLMSAEAAKKFAEAGLGIVAGGLIQKFTSQTPNPKKQALFNGIDPRSFTFNWLLTPQSEAEAKLIETIIATFTKNALPDLENKSDSFFDFPAEFEIVFHNVKGFPALSYCVCTNVSTDYSAGATQLLQSGHSVQVALSLSFSETDLRTKSRPGL